MPFVKTLRKAYKTGKKMAKKRYGLNRKSKGLNYTNIATDVMMLKKMVNAEKKAYQATLGNIGCGQVYQNTTGTGIVDITPLISEGTGYDQRTGKSVKLNSALYQFQIQQQANAVLANKVVIEFWINKGTALDLATARSYLFDTSTFSGVIDFNSPRNQDRFSEFQLIRRVTKVIPADSLTADATQTTFDVPVSFNRGKGHHLRLGGSSGNPLNDVLNGQMFMTIRPQIGNYHPTLVSTKDIPVTGVNTGLTAKFAYKTWYYDN